MGKSVDPVQAFLRRRTFHCVKLNANLTTDECVARQRREVTEKRYGRKITLNNDPQSKWCRSGECTQGQQQLVKLRVKKAKAREARTGTRAAL